MWKLRSRAPIAAMLMSLITAAAAAQSSGPAPAQPPPGPPPGGPPAAPRTPPGPMEVRLLALQRADCNELAKLLRQVALPGAQIATDSRTNTLVIAADAVHGLPQLLSLAERLDSASEASSQGQPRGPMPVIAVRLKAGVPGVFARNLAALLPRGSELRIVPDDATRSLWISGTRDEAARFVELAEQMDAQLLETRVEARETRFYRIANADARQLASTVNEFVKTMEADVRVVADGASNTILAFAGDALHTRLTRIISELDVPPVRRDAPERAAPAGGRPGAAAGGESRPESH